MIINTGLRTDIPAFYSEWFANRLRAGEVCVRNPYNPNAVSRYRLDPDVVDLIAFCTKNPKPMLPYMELLKPYGQFWFVTITPYEKEIEPNVPSKEAVMESVKQLSSIVGADAVCWRYDPIFISEKYTVERHIRDFEEMAQSLAGYVNGCVISFIDLYQKVKRNFPEVREVTASERLQIGKAFSQIGKSFSIPLKTCAEGTDMAAFGIDCSGCMTLETYEQALHEKLHAPKIKSSRTECSCYLSNDIGAYHTCAHFCRYCYANYSAETVRANMKKHDPNSPLLLGNLRPEDVIRDAKQESWLDRQLRLF